MGRPGLEPGTNRLKAECSTIELATRSLTLDVCVVHTINQCNEDFVKSQGLIQNSLTSI
jgi:hypothetical protein